MAKKPETFVPELDGGHATEPPKKQIDPWLAAAITLYAGNIIGWAAWALWSVLGGLTSG